MQGAACISAPRNSSRGAQILDVSSKFDERAPLIRVIREIRGVPLPRHENVCISIFRRRKLVVHPLRVAELKESQHVYPERDSLSEGRVPTVRH